LMSAVARHLVDAVVADDVAVVVATQAHTLAFESAMTRAGTDVAAARTNGNLVTVDADELLSRFLVDDWPNADAFAHEAGSLIRQCVDAGRRVWVYGEMVAVLWDAGHVAAAIELEDLWNELGRHVPFSLFCAYKAQSVLGEQNDDSFHRVCHCHSAVVGEISGRSTATRTFDCDSSALRATRRFVVDTLCSWGLERFVDDASIVVSELATNAVIHARTAYTVTLSSRDGSVRVSVSDASHAVPFLTNPSPTTISGRGLVLVAAIARRWGTEVVGNGKLIWAELGV
jgi:hypothetical protein